MSRQFISDDVDQKTSARLKNYANLNVENRLDLIWDICDLGTFCTRKYAKTNLDALLLLLQQQTNKQQSQTQSQSQFVHPDEDIKRIYNYMQFEFERKLKRYYKAYSFGGRNLRFDPVIRELINSDLDYLQTEILNNMYKQLSREIIKKILNTYVVNKLINFYNLLKKYKLIQLNPGDAEIKKTFQQQLQTIKRISLLPDSSMSSSPLPNENSQLIFDFLDE